MIPRTFPSIIEALQTKMVVYVLPSITGLTAWIDYIPVKGVTTESNALANTYAIDGYQVVKTIESLTGKQAWLDYIPVFESAAYNKPWSTDAGGYIPAGGLFSVASLFANGEQGTWYDPSDLTTLFQDSAGTTPVTAVQQPVGLMLDKSKGLVLGPELVTNGDFSVDANWTKGAGWTISGGVASAVAANSNLSQLNVAASPVGKTYKVTLSITSRTAGSIVPQIGNSFVTLSAVGDYTFYLRPVLSDATFYIPASGFTGTVDNISVKELPGNHAFQTTSASRPVLSARYNQFTETEFRNGVTDAPTRGGLVTATTLTGYLGALAFGHDGSTSTFAYKTNFSVANGTSYLISAVVEMTDGLVPVFNSSDITNSNNDFVFVVGGLGATPTTYSVVPLGGLRYRVSCTATAGSLAANNGVLKYSTNSARTFKVTAYDIRLANDALGQPAYQRVNTATDYDTVGFKPYLAFDGVDDSLVTNSIDFTSTDKMTVFAGVRKLSDAVTAIVAELSVSTDTNTGAFAVFAPSAGGANKYRLFNKGTGNSFADVTSVAFNAPITNVLTGIGDISGDVATLRLNGTQEATSTADQGTGNYGNYPLFIGRRNNASLPFNGRLYSLIVRGAASTTAQITSTETYVNQKTGAY